jgi:peptidoglycan/LPS O-acetylase OafA/YrhL
MASSLASGGAAADVFKQRWFVTLGQSSYCLYMLHLPLWDLAYRKSAPYWNFGLLLIIVLVSLALYKWVEKPTTTVLRSLLIPAPKPVALAADSR